MLSLLRGREGLDGQVVLVKEYVYPALHLIGMGVWMRVWAYTWLWAWF